MILITILFQLFNMSQHMTSHDKSHDSLNASGFESETPTEKLVEVIKCLKREREILSGKVTVAEAATNRLKVELAAAKKELEKKSKTTSDADMERNVSLPSDKLKELQVSQNHLIVIN